MLSKSPKLNLEELPAVWGEAAVVAIVFSDIFSAVLRAFDITQ
jgi:hypothetical protein